MMRPLHEEIVAHGGAGAAALAELLRCDHLPPDRRPDGRPTILCGPLGWATRTAALTAGPTIWRPFDTSLPIGEAAAWAARRFDLVVVGDERTRAAHRAAGCRRVVSIPHAFRPPADSPCGPADAPVIGGLIERRDLDPLAMVALVARLRAGAMGTCTTCSRFVTGRIDPWRGGLEPPECCGPVATRAPHGVRGELVCIGDPPPDIDALLDWMGMTDHVTVRSASDTDEVASAMAGWSCQISLYDRPGMSVAWVLGAAVGLPTIAPTPPPAPGTGENPCAVLEVTRITRDGAVRVAVEPVAATRRADQLLRSPAERAHAARATLAAAPDAEMARTRWYASLERVAAVDE